MTAIEMQQLLDREDAEKPLHFSQTVYELADALRKERYYKDAARATTLRNRDIYIAYYVEKLSYRKIAERYSISYQRVENIIHGILVKNHRKNAFVSVPSVMDKPWVPSKLTYPFE